MRRIRNPRVEFLPCESDEPARHAIALFAASHDTTFTQRFEDFPDRLWDPARQGWGVVVFDASAEGEVHDPYRSMILHEMLDRAGVPHGRAAWLTQDRGYADAYRAYCEASGEAPMKVIVHDYWVGKVIDQHVRDGAQTFEERLAAYRARPRRRERLFLSLNHSLRPTKTLFLLCLIKNGLWDRGFISVGGLELQRQQLGIDQAGMEAYLFGLPGFGTLSERLRPLLPRLDAIGRVILEAPTKPKHGRWALDHPLTEFGRSWFSVIAETEMSDRLCRITEKPLKPLMNFHPFLILGNPGELKLLREYGFQTFPELFDESYDEEADPRLRFEMVYRDFRRLCRLDEDELGRLERQVEEAVIFNAHRALVELPKLYEEQLDPDLVNQLLAMAAPEPSAGPSPQSHRKGGVSVAS